MERRKVRVETVVYTKQWTRPRHCHYSGWHPYVAGVSRFVRAFVCAHHFAQAYRGENQRNRRLIPRRASQLSQTAHLRHPMQRCTILLYFCHNQVFQCQCSRQALSRILCLHHPIRVYVHGNLCASKKLPHRLHMHYPITLPRFCSQFKRPHATIHTMTSRLRKDEFSRLAPCACAHANCVCSVPYNCSTRCAHSFFSHG